MLNLVCCDVVLASSIALSSGATEVSAPPPAVPLLSDVISVRSTLPIDDLLERWSSVPAANDPFELASLEHVRSNRLGIHDLRVAAGVDPNTVVAALADERDVEWAIVNTLGTWCGSDDPLFTEQYALTNIGQTGGTPGADVDAEPAWVLQPGAPSVIIAVLDSGTEITHPDLTTTLWRNADEIADNGIDDDGNGFIDDVDGWDFHNGDNDPAGIYEHGTAVAGIIAARRDNALGIAGLASGTDAATGCRVMPLGVGDIIPDASAIDDAILYAADNGARVITMSLAIHPNAAIDLALESVVQSHDVFIDCAAGNNTNGVAYPASHPLVMAVAATDHDDHVAAFSNVGPEVELAAPGVDIVTLTMNGEYTTKSGTSFAAPHVAALAGLLFSEAPCLSAAEVRAALRATADDVDAIGFDLQTGDGRINATAALLSVADVCPTECPADLTQDAAVDFDDLLLVLAAWGECDGCTADLDQSGDVAFDDVLIVLAAWGACPG